jgi:hypothetical protein
VTNSDVPGGRALEGGTLGRQFDRLRQANPAPADRQYTNASPLDAHPLGDPKPLPGRAVFLELGKFSPALEEIDLGTPEIGQRLLQNLRIKVIQPQVRYPTGE